MVGECCRWGELEKDNSTDGAAAHGLTYPLYKGSDKEEQIKWEDTIR